MREHYLGSQVKHYESNSQEEENDNDDFSSLFLSLESSPRLPHFVENGARGRDTHEPPVDASKRTNHLGSG